MPEKITKRLVDATKPGTKDVFVWDSEVKGFGLKVTPAGSRVYIVQYRVEGGRTAAPKRFTIGKHGSPWTADKARDEAIRILGQVKAGNDPQAQKVAGRESANAKGDTFADIADLFIDRHAKVNTRGWKETKRLLDKHVTPYWGDRPVASITRRDVNKRLDEIVDSGTAVTANRVLAVVRKLFNWAASKDYVQATPCVGVQPPAEEESRDRVLTDDELREVWLAAGGLGDPFGPFVRLLILTAQRRDEVAGMRWSEVDLPGKTWIIPKERAKNGKAHVVPLSESAAEILKAVPRITLEDGKPCDFVFSTTGLAPVSGFSRAKANLDRLVLKARQKAVGEGEEAAPMPGWWFHDLRRTTTTGLARMGIPPQIADRILNHTQGTIKGVAAVYNRHEYLDERRAALDAWARRVDQLVTGKPDNVVELRPAVA
ncbi:site-specific recombinase XerD [Azospirillum brasilense]|uniref:Site-specific recombinase XerD n=1 Tax=Azospirillum brasilense TaxID=192 RepID=A0A560AFV5_AZOBR|nr:site-specific integrase [Azospirillum brasilense]TWA59260.1 site-specific recombinase XerD [Azospirillum brasilense]